VQLSHDEAFSLAPSPERQSGLGVDLESFALELLVYPAVYLLTAQRQLARVDAQGS
jgi:hypothetical protein